MSVAKGRKKHIVILYVVVSDSFPNTVPYWAGFAVINRMIAVGDTPRALPGARFQAFASYFQDLYSNISPLCGIILTHRIILIPRKTSRIIKKPLLGREAVEVSLIYFPRGIAFHVNPLSSSV